MTFPTSIHPKPTSTSDAERSAPHSCKEELPADYEVVLEILATIIEPNPHHVQPPNSELPPPQPEAVLRVLQGPVSAKPPPGNAQTSNPALSADAPPNPAYYAFLSSRHFNIPLLPKSTVSPINGPQSKSFSLSIPNRTFIITVNDKTEPELLDGFVDILRWFCHWHSSPTFSPIHTPAQSGDVLEQMPEHLHDTSAFASGDQPPTGDRFKKIGDKGVQLVEKLGTRLNDHIQRKVSQKQEAVRGDEKKNIKLGGKVTAGALGATRKVVGAGASIASKATEKISGMVAKGMTNNSASRSLSEAPDGSGKKRFHDNLMSGMLAFGRIYVAADAHGKLIIENAGHGAADLASMRYGDEAGNASRQLAGIALDGYRIARFPQKLGATSLLRGALKSTCTAPYCSADMAQGGYTTPPTEPVLAASNGSLPQTVAPTFEGDMNGRNS